MLASKATTLPRKVQQGYVNATPDCSSREARGHRGALQRGSWPGVRRDKTGMLQGRKNPYRKGESDFILTLSLAITAARLWSKRRYGHRWAGLLDSEKDWIRDADLIPDRGKATLKDRERPAGSA